MFNDKPPSEVYYVSTGCYHGAYWTRASVKGALKNNTSWQTYVPEDHIGQPPSYIPHPKLKILRSEIGAAEGWTNVTETFVKDGKWAW
ncbi:MULTISPECIES: hypothetical protein [Streptosporangium]|uniref:Uncharacterized protein n=1 Tax=Streptosporangium brasiliense TaxID=47480 RepID=A0ABT9RMA5_9ACTN|nr:hypothetical protein [Streptosporangium brasiliense]MDP9870417.1 hypothetical protein [Streptosporangium brasiliense]